MSLEKDATGCYNVYKHATLTAFPSLFSPRPPDVFIHQAAFCSSSKDTKNDS
jgi:hypothetical protein